MTGHFQRAAEEAEDSADDIASLRAEVGRLTRKCDALTLSNDARDGMLAELRAGADAAQEAVQTLASERAANARLTAEVESLRKANEAQTRLNVSLVMDNANLLKQTLAAQAKPEGAKSGPDNRLSPFDAVARAMDMASLLAGAVAQSDVDKADRAAARLRSHLIEYIYPKADQQAKSGPAVALTADDMREPKNGRAWRVEWWNESARLMLPNGSKLDRCEAYRNGTLIFTIKKVAAPSAEGPAVARRARSFRHLLTPDWIAAEDAAGGVLAAGGIVPTTESLPAVALTKSQREAVFASAAAACDADHNLSWRDAIVTAVESAHRIPAPSAEGGEHA